MAYLLGTSKYLADLLVAAPDALVLLAEDEALRPRAMAEIAAEMTETAARQENIEAGVRAVRAVRRTELVRIASADLLGLADPMAVSAGLSATMDATLCAALELLVASAVSSGGLTTPPARLAIIALGRLGGHELGYGSDADVLFVYEATEVGSAATEAAAKFANEVAVRLRALLSRPGGDPPVQVDANLRPEGRDGPLVRSLAAYAAYYERWSSIWERQALLRARPAAGDRGLGERFLQLIDPLRYPVDGLDAAQILEIRRLKARIDSERLPRGAGSGYAHQTRPGRIGRRRVDDPVAPTGACARAGGTAPDRDARCPGRRRFGRPDECRRCRSIGSGLDNGHPRPKRDHVGDR